MAGYTGPLWLCYKHGVHRNWPDLRPPGKCGFCLDEVSPADRRINTLCQEYLEYIQAMKTGELSPEEYKIASGQRTLVHDELLLMTGLTRENTHMPTWARDRLNRS